MSDFKALNNFLTLGKAEFAKAIRGAITPELLIRATLTYAQKNPGVFKCTRESIAKCLLDCAALGLLPDGTLGTAYLVPYKTTCTLIIGYRGLIELARRSGQLTSIEAHVVRDGDEFRCEFGLEPILKHVPKLEGAGGRQIVATYAIAHFKDGSHHCEVMAVDEVDAIRTRSRASGNGPWVTDYAEMAKKTVVRRLMKYLPLTPEMADAFDAADREYIRDVDIEDAPPPEKKSDELARRLAHTPQQNVAEEVERNAAERQAAEEASEPAGGGEGTVPEADSVNSVTPAGSDSQPVSKSEITPGFLLSVALDEAGFDGKLQAKRAADATGISATTIKALLKDEAEFTPAFLNAFDKAGVNTSDIRKHLGMNS